MINISDKITQIKGKEILDSKGNPTVKVTLKTKKIFSASVPSGTSKGKYEALELRNKNKGVKKALENINKIIAPKLIGKKITRQKEIDNLMKKLDRTENKSFLGANAILGVSMAVSRGGANNKNLPLYKYLAQITGQKSLFLPTPLILLIEGGLHGKSNFNIQEFMVVPIGNSFQEKFKKAKIIYEVLGQILERKYGKISKRTGLEGGFTPPIRKSKEVLDLIVNAIKNAGFEKEVKIALDIASSCFYSNRVYYFEGKKLSSKELLNFYSKLFEKYPIVSIEDPFAEDDWQGWENLMKMKFPNLLIVGDDLTATNPKRMKLAKEKKVCNGVIIKPNQIGTISETIEAGKLAKSFGWKIIVSHRSGETNDDFIADLSVGLGADFIKSGAPKPKERMVKYQRLIKIEKELNLV